MNAKEKPSSNSMALNSIHRSIHSVSCNRNGSTVVLYKAHHNSWNTYGF